MKTKILFWIDVGLIEFGIANFLQKKEDLELFAIYDLNHHLKKSFQNQKLVNFMKEWYFWDYVKDKCNGELDYNYLINFEKKYGIDLWTLAYADRNLFKYNPYHKFTSDEILKIFEQEIKFFEKVLKETNPDVLIIKTTDFHRNYLLEKMCKSLGIEVSMLIPTRLGYRASIGEDISKFDKFSDKTNENIEQVEFNLENYLKKYDRLKQTKNEVLVTPPSKIETLKIILQWMLKTFDSEYRKSYDHFGMTRFRVIKNEILSRLKRLQRKQFIDRNFVKKIPNNEKFVFFPLQVEPERNISVDAPFFSDQLELIKNIAKSIPIEYWLYVKEHYNMKFRNWRDKEYYKQIINLPNVRLIHPSIKPDVLLKKCSLVLTITSTTGLEAAFYNKPSIIFSDVIYSELSSVKRIKNMEELPGEIVKLLKINIDNEDVINFVKKIDRNSFEFDAFGFHRDVVNRFHNGGLVIGSKISMDDLDLFIKEHNGIFVKLAEEHYKRVNKIKDVGKNE